MADYPYLDGAAVEVIEPVEPLAARPGWQVFDGGAVLLGRAVAILPGRTTSDPAELRRSAAAALAMADAMENGDQE